MRSPALLASFVVALIVGTSIPARADSPATTRRYGFELAAADAAALTITAVASTSRGDRGAIASVSLFTFAPLVHLAHGNRHGAETSLGLRLALPAIGAVAGLVGGAAIQHASTTCAAEPCEPADGLATGAFVGMGIGTLAGMGAAMVIDYAFLGKKRVEIGPEHAAWSPVVSASQHGVSLGVTGTF